MTHITTDVEEEPLMAYARNVGVECILYVSGEDIHSSDAYTIFLNGK